MPPNESLLRRVRDALRDERDVVERKMFGGITFMVNGRMCVSVGARRLMCRIDPVIHEAVTKQRACRTVVMKGRAYRGYVHVDESAVRRKNDFEYWIRLAREFNAKL